MPFELIPLAQAAQNKGLQQTIDTLARTPLSQVVLLAVILSVLRVAMVPYLRNTPPHLRTGVYPLAKLGNEILDAVIYAGVFVFMIIRPFAIQAFLIPSGSMWPTLYVQDFIVANKAIYRYSNPKINDIVVFRPPVEATYGNPDQSDPVTHEVKVDFIKRCKGIPGDIVELRNGVYYRNGKAEPDPMRHYSSTMDYNTFQELSPAETSAFPKASFKFINWNGKIIPLNYTANDANDPHCLEVRGWPYQVHPNYFIASHDEQMKAIAQPAVPLPDGCYFMMGDNRNNSFDGRAWGYVTREQIIGRSEVIWMPLTHIGKTQ